MRSGSNLGYNFLIDRRGLAGKPIPAKPIRGNYALWREACRYHYLEGLYWLLPDKDLVEMNQGQPFTRPSLVPDMRNIIFRDEADFRAGNWQRHYDIWVDMVQFLP